jgi:hypothetical protein
VAYGPTVEIGTPLAPRLLAAAQSAVGRASAAEPGQNDELEACLVAILAAHAAIEASLNEAVEYRADKALMEWWDDREPLRLEAKWADLIERITGDRPAWGSAVRNGIVRLNRDRNLIAHGRGVKHEDRGRLGVSGPPIARRGGIAAVRAHFDSRRAAKRVVDAEAAIALVPQPESRG